MELKPGYKMTEVGVIPEDWEVQVLGDCSDIFRGGSPRPIEAYLTTSSNGYNWIKIGDVQQNEKFIYRTEEKIIKEGVTRSRFVHKGDFLLSNSMSFGRPYILKIDGCIHDGWLVIQNYQPFFDSNFLYYLLCSEYIIKQYKTKAAGSGVLNLNKELVSSIKIIRPTIQEQQAIAAALSDVDELLSSLGQLIAKKKDIRLAAMQELLTGKTRLPGFQVSPAFQITEAGTIPDDWHVTLFGDIVTKIVGGGTPKRDSPEFWGGDIPWATVKDFATFSFDKTQEYITQKGVSASATHIIPAGTLIIATRMALGKTAIYKVNVAINQDLKAIIFNQDIDTNFIRYWFQWQEKNIQSLGSGSTVLGISTDLLKKISIAMPSLAEQQAIASVLSDMDAEIEALEARRDKVRHIKAGMMQELLTGKTRLISSGERA